MNKTYVMKMNRLRLSLKLVFLTSFLSLASASIAQESLSLSDALEKALENNYGIIISKSDVEIAEINNTWGNAGRYPTIGFDVTSLNSEELIDNTTTNRILGGVGLNWTIFNGFKVNITKDKLEKLEEIAKGGYGVTVENMIQDVVMAYYNTLLQKERLEVLREVMKLSEDRYDYEQTKLELGSSLTYDVLLAKNIFLDDKASFLNQEVVVRNAVRNLNFLLGEQPTVLWNFTDEFSSDTTEFILGDLMDKMMTNNQTLKNQYTNLLLQQDEIKYQKGSYYPKVSLSAGIDNSYLWINSGSGETYTETLTPYGNVTISYDIYQGGNRQSAVEIAKINEQITQIETEEIKHSLTNQLYNEFETYNLRKVLLNVANESLEAAKLNLQIAEERFKTGAINSFNYRDIQLYYLNSSINQLQSIYNLIYSNTTLTRLTGGFLEQNE